VIVSRAFVAATALVLTTSPATRAAQPSPIISNSPACSTCSIVAHRDVTVTPPETAPSFFSPTQVVIDSRGNHYVADPMGARSIAVFDRRGAFLATLGKAGGGPGEFQRVEGLLVDAHDSIHVFGVNHTVFNSSRVLVRASQDFDGARISRGLGLADGRLLLHGTFASARHRGQPLHVTDGRGRVVRSFGAGGEPYSASASPLLTARALAIADGASVWTARRNVYELERWSLDGQLLETIARRPPWHAPWIRWNSRTDVEPPPARLMSLWRDRTGLVWTLSRVADAQWKPVPGRSLGKEAPFPPAGEIREREDTILEVIDPRSRRLVTSRRFDEAFDHFLPDGRIAELTEDDHGIVILRLWRPEITGRPANAAR